MLTTKPTQKMIAEWKRIYALYRDSMQPNRKGGTEVHDYFVQKYCPIPFTSDKFKAVVTDNILMNEHNSQKLLRGAVPQIASYKLNDVIVGIDLVTGFIHVESEDTKKAAEIYDDIFLYRGLDEMDLGNFFLVAQYIQLKQKHGVTIRRATENDLDDLLKIFDYARSQMIKNGNPNQWQGGYPDKKIVLNDIADKNSYIIEKDGKIQGTFTFIIGFEPTYQKIEGKWLNNNIYGTIHRLASNGTEKGIFMECLTFCTSQIKNIRVDTHRDNKIMRHLIEKNGFTECGIITVRDGSPRIAYQKTFGERNDRQSR